MSAVPLNEKDDASADTNGFCLELYIHEVTNLLCPIAQPAIAFRILDLPLVLIRPSANVSSVSNPIASVVSSSFQSSITFSSGKSCLFQLPITHFTNLLQSTPLQLLLIDTERVFASLSHREESGATTSDADIATRASVLCTTSLDLRPLQRSIFLPHHTSQQGYHRGTFQMSDLMGNQVARVSVVMRLSCMGSALLPHLRAIPIISRKKNEVVKDAEKEQQERKAQRMEEEPDTNATSWLLSNRSLSAIHPTLARFSPQPRDDTATVWRESKDERLERGESFVEEERKKMQDEEEQLKEERGTRPIESLRLEDRPAAALSTTTAILQPASQLNLGDLSTVSRSQWRSKYTYPAPSELNSMIDAQLKQYGLRRADGDEKAGGREEDDDPEARSRSIILQGEYPNSFTYPSIQPQADTYEPPKLFFYRGSEEDELKQVRMQSLLQVEYARRVKEEQSMREEEDMLRRDRYRNRSQMKQQRSSEWDEDETNEPRSTQHYSEVRYSPPRRHHEHQPEHQDEPEEKSSTQHSEDIDHPFPRFSYASAEPSSSHPPQPQLGFKSHSSPTTKQHRTVLSSTSHPTFASASAAVPATPRSRVRASRRRTHVELERQRAASAHEESDGVTSDPDAHGAHARAHQHEDAIASPTQRNSTKSPSSTRSRTSSAVTPTPKSPSVLKSPSTSRFPQSPATSAARKLSALEKQYAEMETIIAKERDRRRERRVEKRKEREEKKEEEKLQQRGESDKENSKNTSNLKSPASHIHPHPPLPVSIPHLDPGSNMIFSPEPVYIRGSGAFGPAPPVPKKRKSGSDRIRELKEIQERERMRRTKMLRILKLKTNMTRGRSRSSTPTTSALRLMASSQSRSRTTTPVKSRSSSLVPRTPQSANSSHVAEFERLQNEHEAMRIRSRSRSISNERRAATRSPIRQQQQQTQRPTSPPVPVLRRASLPPSNTSKPHHSPSRSAQRAAAVNKRVQFDRPSTASPPLSLNSRSMPNQVVNIPSPPRTPPSPPVRQYRSQQQQQQQQQRASLLPQSFAASLSPSHDRLLEDVERELELKRVREEQHVAKNLRSDIGSKERPSEYLSTRPHQRHAAYQLDSFDSIYSPSIELGSHSGVTEQQLARIALDHLNQPEHVSTASRSAMSEYLLNQQLAGISAMLTRPYDEMRRHIEEIKYAETAGGGGQTSHAASTFRWTENLDF